MDELIPKIKKSENIKGLMKTLEKFTLKEVSGSEVAAINRLLLSYKDMPDIKVGYLTNFMSDFLPPYVNVYCASEGLFCSSYTGAYNQYYQEIIENSSLLKKYNPDILLLALSMRHLEPKINYEFGRFSEHDQLSIGDEIIDHITRTIDEVQKRFSVYLLVGNFPLPAYTHASIADNKERLSEMDFYFQLNSKLAGAIRMNPNVHLLDLCKLSARVGSNNVFIPKMYYMAKMMWSDKFIAAVAEELVRYIIAIKGKTRKCLVLDLDDTIWGGIAGEDGPMGIKIGRGDPVSEGFLDFQYRIKSLKDNGVMLAACSKNNFNDVVEVFEKRPEMPIKLTDFAATKINWDHKHLNIHKLANELNIGVDSMVFIDDNPVECDLVKEMIPEIKTVRLPKNVEEYSRIIDDLLVFDKTVILDDDRKKTEQYLQNRKRKKYNKSVGDLMSYFESLQTQLSIRNPFEDELNRVHQLFTKTNQFNITTRRYTMSEIQRFYRDSNWDLEVFSVRDRFGDLGIVGLYLLENIEYLARIDSFILSCRAMGREIESAVMNYLKKKYCQGKNPMKLEAVFEPTKKNMPMEKFFEKQYFEIIETKKSGSKFYELLPEKVQFFECPWIATSG